MVWVPLFQHGNSWIPDVEVNKCVTDEDEDGTRNIIISLKAIVEITPVVRNGRVDQKCIITLVSDILGKCGVYRTNLNEGRFCHISRSWLVCSITASFTNAQNHWPSGMQEGVKLKSQFLLQDVCNHDLYIAVGGKSYM